MGTLLVLKDSRTNRAGLTSSDGLDEPREEVKELSTPMTSSEAVEDMRMESSSSSPRRVVVVFFRTSSRFGLGKRDSTKKN